METLNETEPHYVRCVKPNSLNRPHKFENPSVLHQLRCGVSGYVILVHFYIFLGSYGLFLKRESLTYFLASLVFLSISSLT